MTAGEIAFSSKAESSSRVCSVLSGASEIVSALRFPAPHPGRRSISSGRVVPITTTGTSVAQPTKCSMKSRRSSSAQCRSSKSKHERQPLGERLEEARPRRERLPALVTRLVGVVVQPDQRPQVTLDPTCLGRLEHGFD